MFNHNARRQSECSLRLHWVLTGDQSRPLGSNWSLDLAQETPIREAAGAHEACNVAVIKKCETSVSRTCGDREARSLTVCGT
jgi:hypothetical protein